MADQIEESSDVVKHQDGCVWSGYKGGLKNAGLEVETWILWPVRLSMPCCFLF
jgi:hypothetical protein